MFNGQRSPTTKAPRKPATARDANAVTILTSGCHFNGKLYCRGATRIAGRIEGQLISEGLLIIEDEAIITAEIKADEVIIQGRVEGRLTATGRVELAGNSQFVGDILTPLLIIREGAQFNGNASMPRREEAASAKGAPRITAVKNGKDQRTPGFEPGAKADIALKAPEVNVTT